ncbi:MAG: DNA-binding response regulator [Alteromonadaceae bacterium]|nr:MAG: DNA-binding response regulator [Alteromonadaceae bacterium]
MLLKTKILIIEDNDISREMIEEILTEEGYEVQSAATGTQGWSLAEKYDPDLILLDLGLPDIDGAQLAKRFRKTAKTKDILLIVLSARDSELDIVTGLECYADDYITKPFKDKMLTAHIKAVLRRKNTKDNTDLISINEITLNIATMTAKTEEGEIALSKTEFDILFALASKPERIYSRAQIITIVKGEDFPVTERAVDMSIARLRKKLGKAGEYIETVRGAGYRFCKKQ